MAAILSLTVFVLGAKVYSPTGVIAWDSFGYYLYLPQLLIHNDLALKDMDTLKKRMEGNITTSTFYQANQMPDGRWQLRYTSGMAIMYLPGFVAGHAMAVLSDADAHGYSQPYHRAILWWSLLVSAVGIWVLRAVLLRFFNDRYAALVLLLIVAGTNYLVHVTVAASAVMPHNYLFTGYALLLLFTLEWNDRQSMGHALAIGAVCGIMILARPTEVVCLLIPVLWGVTDKVGVRERLVLFLNNKRQIAGALMLMVAIGCIQLVYWKWVTGSFVSFSYGGNVSESFDFERPHIVEVLFSYRKGWLLYTPLMVLGIIGLFRSDVAKQNRWAILSYLALNLYLVASWHNWWYAESYSQRALIPSYPIMALALGGMMCKGSTLRQGAVIGAGVLLMGLNLFQSWQWQQGIIDASRMTKAYYWAVFGSTEVNHEAKNLLLVDRMQEQMHTVQDPHRYRKLLWEHVDYEQPMADEWVKRDSTRSFSGRFSGHMPPTTEFTPAIRAKYWEFTAAPHMWLRLSVMVRPELDPETHPFCLVISVVNSGVAYLYWADGSKGKGMKAGEWNHFTTDVLTPDMHSTDDEISLYLWNNGRNDLHLDDLKVEYFQPLERP